MKKIYMILSTVLISGTVLGQINKPKANLDKSIDNRISPVAELPVYTERDIIWSNTFSDGNDWVLDDDGVVGLTWSIGTGLVTTGDAPIAEINSDTYSDGAAMVDSDVFENTTGVENCWFQNANPIDCSANPYVHIEFSNQYFMWDGGANDGNEYCLLEVKTENTDWPDISTYEVADAPSGSRFELWPNMLTQDNVSNPTTVRFNISELAGNASEVEIRFRWVGTWGYAWFVDDVVVFDGYSSDLAVQGQAFATGSSYTNLNGTRFVPIEEIDGEVVTGLEYFKYPTTQRPDIMAYTPVINWGDQDLTDVVVSGTFNGNTYSSDPQPLAAGEALDSVAILQWPTLGVAEGTYDFELVASSELEDEDETNNTATAGLEMTQYIMARDNNVIEGQLPGGANQGMGFSGGPLFEIFGDDMVYAIDIALTNNTVPGEEILVSLLDGTTENFDPLSESDEVVIYDSNFNDFEGDVTWATVVLDPPVSVTNGDLVLPVLTYFGGEGVQLGEAQSDAPDQTAFIFGDFGTAGVDWYFTNDIPMVRLNFDPEAVTTIEDVTAASSFILGQNIPNPAAGNAVVNYELIQSGKVTFDVYDVTGKQVFNSDLGHRGAGKYTIDLDTDDLTSGMYTYVLTVNGEQLTKKMMVK